MDNQQSSGRTSDRVADLPFEAMQALHLKPRAIVKLPPASSNAPNHSRYISINSRSSHAEEDGNPTSRDNYLKPPAAAVNWQERFKRLTASEPVQQQDASSQVLHDSFGDPIDAIRSSNTDLANTGVVEEDIQEPQQPVVFTPLCPPPKTPAASVSSRTAALLLEGAKTNWENICAALLVEVEPHDKEILKQITTLVHRLGTESGPLSFAHQPQAADLELTAAADVDTTTVPTRRLVDDAIKATKWDISMGRAESDEDRVEEDEEELQARQERIASSLLMRRQQQPIRK
ncbi:MAG: hypothetical protein L6R40_003678 [Gallowayella cf. fulva]|nr:MAG: hypothetical protein L6R40_003678 [Xanthomendoza cf. fulva]